MRFDYSRKFTKEFARSTSQIKDAFKERLVMFENNPFHPILHNHALTGPKRGLRSINITGDWRAIFEEENDVVYFVEIGTHSQLYKK